MKTLWNFNVYIVFPRQKFFLEIIVLVIILWLILLLFQSFMHNGRLILMNINFFMLSLLTPTCTLKTNLLRIVILASPFLKEIYRLPWMHWEPSLVSSFEGVIALNQPSSPRDQSGDQSVTIIRPLKISNLASIVLAGNILFICIFYMALLLCENSTDVFTHSRLQS